MENRKEDGTLTPGAILNPNGRPKGALNKENQQIKEVVSTIIEFIQRGENMQTMLNDLMVNKPDVLINFIAKVAPKDIYLNKGSSEYTPNPLFEILQQMREDKLKEKGAVIEVKPDDIKPS